MTMDKEIEGTFMEEIQQYPCFFRKLLKQKLLKLVH